MGGELDLDPAQPGQVDLRREARGVHRAGHEPVTQPGLGVGQSRRVTGAERDAALDDAQRRRSEDPQVAPSLDGDALTLLLRCRRGPGRPLLRGRLGARGSRAVETPSQQEAHAADEHELGRRGEQAERVDEPSESHMPSMSPVIAATTAPAATRHDWRKAVSPMTVSWAPMNQ